MVDSSKKVYRKGAQVFGYIVLDSRDISTENGRIYMIFCDHFQISLISIRGQIHPPTNVNISDFL